MTTGLTFNCQQEAALPGNGKNRRSSIIKKKIFTAYGALLITLPLLSLFFLYLEHVTHYVFLEHVAAIPLEIMFGAIIVERFLARREKKGRLRLLMHMKSHIFRSQIREVFINSFNALESPQIDIPTLVTAELQELYRLRENLNELTYRSIEELETVVLSYIDTRDAFVRFMDWAMQHGFEDILEEVVYVLHFIQDVRLYKESYPGKLFVEYAMSTPQGCEKLRTILTGAVTKFLDYAIELKSERPELYDELMHEYLLVSEKKKTLESFTDDTLIKTA
jgi:hypothetical protein